MLNRLLLALLAGVGLAGVPASTSGTTPPAPVFSTLAASHQSTGAYTPAQIQAAYGITPLLGQGIDGAGQTIALIEFDRFDPADIQQFDAANQLADPTLQTFFPAGHGFTLQTSGEATLDIEWAHALAPAATIQVYYVQDGQSSRAGWKTLATAINAAVAGGASTISMSFGACKPGTSYQVTRNALAASLQHGVNVFVSSGDSGAHPGPVRQCGSKLGVTYPASDPSVVSVGGTSLLLNDDGTISQETAWRLSGGGKGSPLPRPIWQLTSNLKPGKYRWVPDVAFLGDPATGVEVFYHGAWHQAGGTSLGAPAWAAIWTLIQEDAQHAGKSIGAAPAILYGIGNSSSYMQAFSNITQGSNGHYHAGAGWNPVTGWGTPKVSGLASAILALSAASP
ncbi:MAG: S53 family peptidase [Chloroflexota bacterium]